MCVFAFTNGKHHFLSTLHTWLCVWALHIPTESCTEIGKNTMYMSCMWAWSILWSTFSGNSGRMYECKSSMHACWLHSVQRLVTTPCSDSHTLSHHNWDMARPKLSEWWQLMPHLWPFLKAQPNPNHRISRQVWQRADSNSLRHNKILILKTLVAC